MNDAQRAFIRDFYGKAQTDSQREIVEDAARGIGATDQEILFLTNPAEAEALQAPFLDPIEMIVGSGAGRMLAKGAARVGESVGSAVMGTRLGKKVTDFIQKSDLRKAGRIPSSMRLTAQTGRAAGLRALPPKSGLGKMPQDLPTSPGTVAANAPRQLPASSGRTVTPIGQRIGVGGPEAQTALPTSGQLYSVRPLGGGVTTPAKVTLERGQTWHTQNLPSTLSRLRDAGQAPARSVAESASTLRTGAAVAGKSFGRGTQFFDDAGRAFEVTAKPFKGKFTAKSLETGEVRQFSAFKPYRTLKTTPTAQAGSEVLPENVFAP